MLQFLEALSQMDEAVGLYLHEVAFQPVISSQGSDEQQAYWMPKCLNHEILGCYAQTELGHGSNVQQLETIATYDHATKTFDLHTPFVTSTKWWVGALGIMATHSAVQARLILDGKDMGPHLFITQIRSLEDHSLMPGVEAGEIGPKVHGGMASVDNGCRCLSSFETRADSRRGSLYPRQAAARPDAQPLCPDQRAGQIRQAPARQAELRRHDLHPRADDHLPRVVPRQGHYDRDAVPPHPSPVRQP